ncbi:hypothetical protein DTO217A2_4468 [Paecilomyces variotii]|nr:hypothetical protein DTO217A2_4468 [Paecilomyces variotii]
MEDGKPVDGSLYIYAPNKGAPIFFAFAFAVSAFYHLWQCYHFKCFKLTGLHPLCAAMFAAGFALREYGAFHYLYTTRNLIMYIVSLILIYVNPPLLELANYHVLGRTLHYVPYFSPLDPGRVLTIFGTLSAVVEGLNGTGVSLLANKGATQSNQNIGRALTMVALAMQLVVIAIFSVLAGIFHWRCIRANLHTKITPSLITLYMSTSLIFIRCIYRVVEESGSTTPKGDDLMTLSPILRYEWFFYVFEATVMLLNSFLWNVRHPRHYLPESSLVYLARDGTTELVGRSWTDNRPWIIAHFDPFGIFVRKEKEKRPFWELHEYSGINRED